MVRTSNRCQLWLNAFDELTPEAAYWVGFLFADGSVYEDAVSKRISVRVSERDREHLVKLRAFLRSTHTIGTGPAGNYGGYQSRPSVRFSIRSEQLAERILRLGRYDGPIEATLVGSRDFWRGVTDGDGSLGILETGYTYFSLVGSRRLLEAFLLFLRNNDLAAKMTIRPDKTIFQIATAGYTAEKIVHFLYANADVTLDRKAVIAAKIMAIREARLSAERSRLSVERSRLAQIAEWYQGGESLKQIAARLEVSNVTILRWMDNAGIPRRKRHGGRRSLSSSS